MILSGVTCSKSFDFEGTGAIKLRVPCVLGLILCFESAVAKLKIGRHAVNTRLKLPASVLACRIAFVIRAALHLDRAQREKAKAEAQTFIDAASRDLERGVIDTLAWSQRVADALASAYLLDDDPRWQSGFDGDSQLWREARELILAPVNEDGSFLDIGCATGYLLECLKDWAWERGRLLDMFGLELSPSLVAAARRRAPVPASHIFEGNVLDWVPPRRFTFVHTGLEYVPASRQPWLVRHLLDEFLEPGGRLIVGPVTRSDLRASQEAFEAAGASSDASEYTDHNGKTRYVLSSSGVEIMSRG